ncbi:MAG: NADH-quinone oxidoreductase subunit H [Candidatus Bipolaricaulota bacterium]|nr:MAG: NADH-quinone oxidoreductase subunit H [Candidatus Bipolaricaulota bacterium]
MTVSVGNAVWQGLIILLGGGLLGLVYKGFDRKLAAQMQGRIGPPLRQPFFDVVKLMVKENIVPDHAVGWLFNLMPVISLAAVATILFYLPLGGYAPLLGGYGDLVLILYLLAVPALAMMVGGFAASSPYASVGAQREMVMLMSYEFPLAIALVGLAWRLSTILPAGSSVFSLGVLAANPLWGLVGPLGIVGLALLMLALLVVTPAELSKIPFDIPEAETEIAGGILAEYSGRNLALFYLSDAVKTVVMGALVVALFIPYGLSGLAGLTGAAGAALDVVFFLVKLFVVVFVSVIVVRVGFARLKVNQVARLFWLPVTAFSFLGLLLLAVDRVI